MLFNSLEFLLFLPIVFILYWFVFKKYLKLQNALLLIASYIFYGWWDWRFLGLILVSTILDYVAGIKIKTTNYKKFWLVISMVFNLSVLFFFKYYNFFVDSLIYSLSQLGVHADFYTLNIILPVGISFYTFQTMSYTIDVYKNQIEPTKDFISFAAFVSFFPQLVAGPIERASNLLPQVLTKRKFNFEKAVSGLKLVIWGFLKKVVLADSLAPIVNQIFDNYTQYSSWQLIIGAIFFSFQIYGDFSGYSDIARGLARLFGFELMVNFNFPYFSRNISEFWKRWHISLSSWFRDYVYIPLGGSRSGKWMSLRNVFVIFLLSGFWHGANWTFIIWGGIHAALYIPSFILGTNRKYVNQNNEYSILQKLKDVPNILVTFVLVVLAWVFFRAENLSHATGYLESIFSLNTESSLLLNPYNNQPIHLELGLVLCFVLLEIFYLSMKDSQMFNNKWVSGGLQSIGIIVVILFVKLGKESAFIYFQF